MRIAVALKPDVPSFGYAAYLSINATSIWGGIFPYLSDAARTPELTLVFYTVQLAAFLAAFCAMMGAVWARPQLARGAHVLACGLAMGVGSLMLVGAMYLEAAALPLIVGAAALVGVGSAGFMVGWQRVFASCDAARGNLALIKGTGYSAVIYFCICLIPAALTAYLVPLCMVPLAGLCLFIAAQGSDTAQPMFDDVPRDHAVVYRNALRESFLPALSVAALGFCSGAVRLIAVTHQELLSTINIVSMFALLIVASAFYAVWARHTIHVDLMSVYRVLFPVAATFLVVLPFAGAAFAPFGSAAAYACFMLACVLMMMHCGQISRDSGINPVIIFAFYGAVTYGGQLCGYLVGYASGSAMALGVEQLSFVGLVALYALLVVALVGRRVDQLHTNRLEFLTLSRAGAQPPAAPAEVTAEIAAHKATGAAPAEPPIIDRLSKRCLQLSELYGLSSRETEVMELIARGFTGPAIAEQLFISENTMRTHNKRIYAKLGIHKKQELLELLDRL